MNYSYDNISEESLWILFKNGDIKAFEIIYKSNFNMLLRYCLRMGIDEELANEAIQELFIYIWEKRKNLGEIKSIKGYLIKSLKRDVLKRKNKQQYKSDIDEDIINRFSYKEDDFENVDLEKEMLKRLNQLPEKQREILFLRYYEGLSMEDLCLVLNLKYQSTRNLIHRAISKLKENINKI